MFSAHVVLKSETSAERRRGNGLYKVYTTDGLLFFLVGGIKITI